MKSKCDLLALCDFPFQTPVYIRCLKNIEKELQNEEVDDLAMQW